MAVKRSAGTSGALLMAIRQLVLAGLPTTTMRASAATLSLMALPWLTKIGLLALSRSLRSMPAVRGRAPDQQRPVSVGKGYVRLIGQDGLCEKGKGAVVQLHGHAFERAHRRRDLQQLQDDRLIRAEQIAISDAKDEGIADITGRAGYCYTNWDIHYFCISWCGRGQDARAIIELYRPDSLNHVASKVQH